MRCVENGGGGGIEDVGREGERDGGREGERAATTSGTFLPWSGALKFRKRPLKTRNGTNFSYLYHLLSTNLRYSRARKSVQKCHGVRPLLGRLVSIL